MAAYVGEYHCDELAAVYRFTVRQDALWVQVNQRRPERLLPTLKDEFIPAVRTYDDARLIQFSRADGGRIAGFKLSLGRVKDVRFVKRD